jgi:hypothetical protein
LVQKYRATDIRTAGSVESDRPADAEAGEWSMLDRHGVRRVRVGLVGGGQPYPPVKELMFTPVDAFTTREECMVVSVCLPETIDPRGPKAVKRPV